MDDLRSWATAAVLAVIAAVSYAVAHNDERLVTLVSGRQS